MKYSSVYTYVKKFKYINKGVNYKETQLKN